MLGLLFQRSVEHVQTYVSKNDSCREGTDVKTYRRGAFRYQCLMACCNINLVDNLCNASIFDCLLSLPARISSLQMFDLFGLRSREICSRTGGCVQILQLLLRNRFRKYSAASVLSNLHARCNFRLLLWLCSLQRFISAYMSYCIHMPLL